VSTATDANAAQTASRALDLGLVSWTAYKRLSLYPSFFFYNTLHGCYQNRQVIIV
jgi:hypothetical protein